MLLFSLLLISVSLALYGMFSVFRKEGFFVVSLGHAAFGGAALSQLLSLPTYIFNSLFTSFLAVTVKKFMKDYEEGGFGFVFSVSLALGIISLYLMGYSNSSLLLFGSLLSLIDNNVSIIVSLFSLIWLFVRWKDLAYVSFDKEFYKVYRKDYVEYEFYVVFSILIAVAVESIGGLLVAAFSFMPSMIALAFERNIRDTFFITIILSLFGSVLSYYVSFFYSIPYGVTFIIVMFLNYLLVKLGLWLRNTFLP